jgi:hypothetical protein
MGIKIVPASLLLVLKVGIFGFAGKLQRQAVFADPAMGLGKRKRRRKKSASLDELLLPVSLVSVNCAASNERAWFRSLFISPSEWRTSTIQQPCCGH